VLFLNSMGIASRFQPKLTLNSRHITTQY
jgi:hypothetical protein